MINIIMVSTLGSPWVQQQELVPGDPATGPPYYSGGTETGDQRTNERTSGCCSVGCMGGSVGCMGPGASGCCMGSSVGCMGASVGCMGASVGCMGASVGCTGG